MAAIDTFKTLLNGATPPADAYITALLNQADALILGYTRLASVPAALDSVRAALALVLFNRAGAEGEYKRVEGEITTVFETIPQHIALALRPYRSAVPASLLTVPAES